MLDLDGWDLPKGFTCGWEVELKRTLHPTLLGPDGLPLIIEGYQKVGFDLTKKDNYD